MKTYTTPEGARELYSRCYASSAYKMGKDRLDRVLIAVLCFAPHGPNRNLLDVGCGRGELIAEVRRRSDTVCEGCEIVPALCEDPAIALIDTIVDLPFTNREFDCVVCSDVLEHLDPTDSNAALRELWRVTFSCLIIHVAWFPSPSSILGIGDVELHPNRRPFERWRSDLRRVIGVEDSIVHAEEVGGGSQGLFVVERGAVRD